jgi:hypothetical protein
MKPKRQLSRMASLFNGKLRASQTKRKKGARVGN